MALGDTIKRLFSNDEDDSYDDSYDDSSYQEQPQYQQPVQQTSQQQATYFGRQSAQSTMTDPGC